MSEIPKLIEFLGTTISIKRMDELTVDGNEAWGSYEAQSRIICISTKTPTDRQWPILFHELSHAILDITGLSHLFSNKQQEAICDSFGNALAQLIMEGGLDVQGKQGNTKRIRSTKKSAS